jgi:hypothetical protein
MRASLATMSRQPFEEMVAQRIELASAKTSQQVAAARDEVNVLRRQTLEDCGLAVALAASCLRDLRAASGVAAGAARRDLHDAWHRMEVAVRLVTGEPAVTLVPPLAMPGLPPPTAD